MNEFKKVAVFTDESETSFVLDSEYSQQEANKLFKEYLLPDYDDFKIKKIYLGYIKKDRYFEYVICGANEKDNISVWIAELGSDD